MAFPRAIALAEFLWTLKAIQKEWIEICSI